MNDETRAVNRFTHCPTCGADGTQIHLHPDGPISPSAYRYICTACDTVIEGRRVFQADDIDAVNLVSDRFVGTSGDPAAVTLDADAVTLTIAGVGVLPQGSVITVSVVVGPDGPVVTPPAATPPAEAQKPRRYINGGG